MRAEPRPAGDRSRAVTTALSAAVRCACVVSVAHAWLRCSDTTELPFGPTSVVTPSDEEADDACAVARDGGAELKAGRRRPSRPSTASRLPIPGPSFMAANARGRFVDAVFCGGRPVRPVPAPAVHGPERDAPGARGRDQRPDPRRAQPRASGPSWPGPRRSSGLAGRRTCASLCPWRPPRSTSGARPARGLAVESFQDYPRHLVRRGQRRRSHLQPLSMTTASSRSSFWAPSTAGGT